MLLGLVFVALLLLASIGVYAWVGSRIAKKGGKIPAEKFGIPFARLRPPIEGGDWNDVLRASCKSGCNSAWGLIADRRDKTLK